MRWEVYSYFERGCRKTWTPQSRRVMWVVFSSLFLKEIWKNGTIEKPWKYVCECWSKATNVGLTATVSGTVYWSYDVPYCLSGLSRAHFSNNLSRNSCIWWDDGRKIDIAFHEMEVCFQKGWFSRFNFAACNALTISSQHKLCRLNKTYDNHRYVSCRFDLHNTTRFVGLRRAHPIRQGCTV